MPVNTLKNYLDENGVKYTCVSHSPAYTSQEVAESAHVSGKRLAKTVIIKKDGELTMVVLPADHQVDFDDLKSMLSTNDINIANEQEFDAKFPDCELGCLPPFGHLYDMKVYMSDSLAEFEHIAFNAGNYKELIELSYDDYTHLTDPNIINI